jgi:NADH-quinone oxidoreductase subunit H
VGFDFGIIPFLKGFTFSGLGQPLADGLKFIFKEDYEPLGVDKVLFTLAPGLMIFVIIISIAVIPWGGTMGEQSTISVPASAANDVRGYIEQQLPPFEKLIGNPVPNGMKGTFVTTTSPAEFIYIHGWAFQIADLNIGVFYILAVLSLAVYGVVIGGWASNNKYSFLGALRATANMISYEIPLGLAVLTIVLMFGTLDLGVIVERQAHNWGGFLPAWNVFCQPLAFLMFLVCIHAEANRAPFDLAEAEQELVGGYHTEYSSMRFALFFLSEYAGMITTSAVCVALFFGGWDLPGLRGPIAEHPGVTSSLLLCLIRSLVFYGKTMIVIFVFMWVRWSLPRFRFDQLMMLAWRALIPISLAGMLATAVVIACFPPGGRDYDLDINGWMAVSLFGANVVVLVGSMWISRLLPPPPDTNRRVKVLNSRFNRAPLPGGPGPNGSALPTA